MSGPAEAFSAEEALSADPAWLEHELVVLEARIQKGQDLIDAQHEREGTDNLRWLRHMQDLQQQREQFLQCLEWLRSQAPLCFVEARRRRAEAAFRELVAMSLRREYDTPRYLEQDLLVRSYLRDDPEWADRLLAGD